MGLTFWQLLLQRIKSENPEFYKKLQKIVLWTLIGDAVLYAFLWLNVLLSPQWHDKLTKGCIGLALLLAGSFFTTTTGTKDPNLVSNDTKAAIVNDAIVNDPNNDLNLK